MRRCLEALLGLTILLAPLPAAAQGLPPPPAMTAEQQRQTAWASERGRLLFALDRAAWVGTDDALERIPRAETANLIGYIVDRDAAGQLVTIFFAEEGGQLVAAYRGKVGPAGIVSREIFRPGQRPRLTPGEQRLARTLQHLRGQALQLSMCASAGPNVAIVPPDRPGDPVDVYVMTPQTEPNVLPFGGHHRLSIDANGRIVSRRAFSNSCLNVADSRETVSHVVTHLLDPQPTELHVFSALALGKPLMVSAGEQVWSIEDGNISLVANMGDLPPTPEQ